MSFCVCGRQRKILFLHFLACVPPTGCRFETPPLPLLPVCPSWCQTRRSCSNWLGERPTAARHAAQKHSNRSRLAAPSVKTQLSISHLTRQEWVSYRGNQHGRWTQSNAQWLIYLVLMGGTNSKLGLERLVPSLKSTSAGGVSDIRDPPQKNKQKKNQPSPPAREQPRHCRCLRSELVLQPKLFSVNKQNNPSIISCLLV